MSSPLSERLKDPAALLSACQKCLPSWSGATLDTFTCSQLSGGYSSPGLYLVGCTKEGATPARAVVKLETESEDHPFYRFYQGLVTSGGPYQGRVARQLAEAGLGPEIFYVEQDKMSDNWGIIVMEELPDGGFDEDFSPKNVSCDDMTAIGCLLGKIHMLPTCEVSKAADQAKILLLQHGMDRDVVEELYESRGGYIIFLILWWKKNFPEWMSKNSPLNHPLPDSYVERFLNLILTVGRIKPRTTVFGRLGFSHTDVWHRNLMRKGDKIVAIDCETASTGPAFLDLGGVIANAFNVPHMERNLRESLILSFYKTIGEECRDMEAALYDLELASMYRWLWGVLCIQFGLVSASLADVEKIGGLIMEKGEAMVSGMEKAVDDDDMMKNIIAHGIFRSIKNQLTEGREEIMRKFFEGQ